MRGQSSKANANNLLFGTRSLGDPVAKEKQRHLESGGTIQEDTERADDYVQLFFEKALSTKWRNKNGLLHRENGPAFYGEEFEGWFLEGKCHREDGPAITNTNAKIWMIHGEHHRVDGPAIVGLRDNSERWYFDGLLHREGGPACVWATGQEDWYKHGKKHRLDGPAYVRLDGTQEWWIDGQLIREAKPV